MCASITFFHFANAAVFSSDVLGRYNFHKPVHKCAWMFYRKLNYTSESIFISTNVCLIWKR